MAMRLPASDFPELMVWCERHFPATFKLHAEVKSHPRGRFPGVDIFVDRWPDPKAVAAVVDPDGELAECRVYFKNTILGVYGESTEALRSLFKHCPFVDWTQPVKIEG